MFKQIILSAALSMSILTAFAQDEFDALRYSQTYIQGTARSVALGGASGSMGGDFSSLSVNPAGIGIYRSSEFMFTPTLAIVSNKSKYLNSEVSSSATKFNVGNAGIVVTTNYQQKNNKPKHWRTFSFGFGMNRSATFKNEYKYSGNNYQNSITEKYADDFNHLGGINEYAFSRVNYQALAAYQTYLIDRGLGNDSMKAVSYVPFTDGIQQTKIVNEKGGMSEYVVSIGGNYNDKLLLGATLGIIGVKYERITQYNEIDISGDLNNDFKYMNVREQLNTEGTGINLKIGAIYKVNQNFRLGMALHSPTQIALSDVSSISMESHTDSLFLQQDPFANPIKNYYQDSALVFNYSMRTPFKAVFSGCYLFGKLGLITADVEYVNYGSMRYNYGIEYKDDSRFINSMIRQSFQNTLNIRLGAEAKFDKLSLRAGYAHLGSAYQSTTLQNARSIISLGMGYRGKYWYLDAVFLYGMQSRNEYPYVLDRNDANVSSANINMHAATSALTLGIKF
ncbi:MAG: outer membrane protein transport protein [Bacteroidetes bacterium]|nr:outer membrane protein transport protein [Bacteroidota bacterium]